MKHIIRRKITFIDTGDDPGEDINRQLQWLSNSLGLFNERDKESSCFRIFVEVVKAKKDHRNLSSDDIAQKAHLSRGTVIHHINKLMDSGLVAEKDRRYILDAENFKDLSRRIRKYQNELIDKFDEIADEIDNSLGF